MSVAELARDIGRVGRYRAQGVEGALAFSVVVRDVRHVFGRVDYEIEPVDGAGRCWVSESSVRLGDK
jgi:hypothetical protein